MRKIDHLKGLVKGTVAILFFSSHLLFGLEPPTKAQIQEYIRDGTLEARIAEAEAFGNHKADPELVRLLHYRLRRIALELQGFSPEEISKVLAPPPGRTGIKTKGTVKILALLIAFSDYPGLSSSSSISAKLFGEGEGGYPYESLRNYYRRSSYNQLEIQGNVLGWYTTSYVRSNIAETSQGRESLIKEALNYYDSQGHDFSQYDNDNNGTIDYFCVFWTGPHGAWATFWWGYYTGFTDSSYRVDGKKLTRYSWQWELSGYPKGTFTPGTVIHETGHALGLPDYYDYDDTKGPRGGVGRLDMMDGSSGDHGCFSKFMLDWITPAIIATGNHKVELRASGGFQDAMLFWSDSLSGSLFDEFFMVQNRFRTANDSYLFTRTDGLLIWHVDARLNSSGQNFLFDNSYTDHKLLRLMEADGLEEIEMFARLANAGDYYLSGCLFGPETVPNSNRYDGLLTQVGIQNISESGPSMSFEVYDLDASPTVTIANFKQGEILYGTIKVEANASDDFGINSIELYFDKDLKASSASTSCSFALDTRTVSNGDRTIKAVVYDTIKQIAVSQVEVSVENIYAPLNLRAEKVLNRSLSQTEYMNSLVWEANPKNVNINKYRVYLLEGQKQNLLAEVFSAPFKYWHRKVEKDRKYQYVVVAVGSLDREGDEASISVK